MSGDLWEKAWTASEAAKAWGVSVRWVNKLVSDGVVPKSENGFDPIEATASYIKNIKTSHKSATKEFEAERTRLTRANADLKEVQLERERGELIDVSLATKLWASVIMNQRRKILSMPTKLAPLVLGSDVIAEVKEIIERFTHEVLDELANPDLGEVARMDSNSPGAAGTKTASKSKRKRVGGHKEATEPRK